VEFCLFHRIKGLLVGRGVFLKEGVGLDGFFFDGFGDRESL
jgi:hypothetical protein